MADSLWARETSACIVCDVDGYNIRVEEPISFHFNHSRAAWHHIAEVDSNGLLFAGWADSKVQAKEQIRSAALNY